MNLDFSARKDAEKRVKIQFFDVCLYSGCFFLSFNEPSFRVNSVSQKRIHNERNALCPTVKNLWVWKK